MDYNDEFDGLEELIKKFEQYDAEQQYQFLSEEDFEQLVAYYTDIREFKIALNLIEKAQLQFPFSSNFLIQKAEILTDQGFYEEGLELLDQAELFNPSDLRIKLIRSDIYTWMEMHEASEKIILNALETAEEEDLEDLYLELADIYEDWEKYDKLIEALKDAILLNVQNEEAMNRLWFAFEMTERFDESIQFHKTLIDDDPYNQFAWFNLAQVYISINQLEQAIDALEFVIAINENCVEAYLDLGDSHYKLGNYHKAIDAYLSTQRMEKAGKEILMNVAICYDKLGIKEKARNYVKQVIAIDPEYHEGFYLLGNVYREDEKYDDAIFAYEKAVKLQPNEVSYLVQTAACYYHKEMLDEAIKYYEKALSLDEQDPHLYFNLSICYFESGILDIPLELSEKSIEKFPNHAICHYLTSIILFVSGKLRESYTRLEAGLLLDASEHKMLLDLYPEMMLDPQVLALVDEYNNRKI